MGWPCSQKQEFLVLTKLYPSNVTPTYASSSTFKSQDTAATSVLSRTSVVATVSVSDELLHPSVLKNTLLAWKSFGARRALTNIECIGLSMQRIPKLAGILSVSIELALRYLSLLSDL